MVRYSDLEPMELTENNNDTPTQKKPSELTPKKEPQGYTKELGIMGQPTSFYVGICCGILFHVFVVSYVWSALQ